MTTISPRKQTSVTPLNTSQPPTKERTDSIVKAGTSALGALVSAAAIVVIAEKAAIGGVVLASVCPPLGLIVSCVALAILAPVTHYHLKNVRLHSQEQVQIRYVKTSDEKLRLNLEEASENKLLAEFPMPTIAAPKREAILPEANILNPNLKSVTFSDPNIGQDEGYKDIYSAIRTKEDQILFHSLKAKAKAEGNSNKGADDMHKAFMLEPRTKETIEDMPSYLADRRTLKEAGYDIRGSIYALIKIENKKDLTVTFSDPDIGQDEGYKDIYSAMRTEEDQILFNSLKAKARAEGKGNRVEDEMREAFTLEPKTKYTIKNKHSYLADRQTLKDLGYNIRGRSIFDLIKEVNEGIGRWK